MSDLPLELQVSNPGSFRKFVDRESSRLMFPDVNAVDKYTDELLRWRAELVKAGCLSADRLGPVELGQELPSNRIARMVLARSISN